MRAHAHTLSDTYMFEYQKVTTPARGFWPSRIPFYAMRQGWCACGVCCRGKRNGMQTPHIKSVHGSQDFAYFLPFFLFLWLLFRARPFSPWQSSYLTCSPAVLSSSKRSNEFPRCISNIYTPYYNPSTLEKKLVGHVKSCASAFRNTRCCTDYERWSLVLGCPVRTNTTEQRTFHQWEPACREPRSSFARR